MSEHWRRVEADTPPARTDLLGFDMFYKRVHVVQWDGEQHDDLGRIRLIPVNGNDDVAIMWWAPLPEPPPFPGAAEASQ